MKVLTLFFMLVSMVTAQEGAVNCDEICASQVAEATRTANQQMAAIEDQLAPLRSDLDDARKRARSATSDLDKVKNQLSDSEDAVRDLQSKLANAEQAAAAAEASAASQIAAMEAELQAAKAKASECAEARFFVNQDLIQDDIKGLLKQYGLMKSEELKDEM